ncbi:MAG TPA: mechanosensitive ion channel domain-containing protein [Qipengyuania sp.]|nr:mechanosensitive ion channel domain-containing protein [Qipengyuania sp.]
MAAAQSERDVAAADELRSAVSRRSDTVGDIVGTLDSWALSLGSLRISLWDILVVIAIVVFCFLLAKLGSKWARRAVRRAKGLDSTQALLTEKLITIAIWAVAAFLAIDLLGIDLTALAVFSGAFGLAIGFGLQKTFGNLIAGMILLMDKSIKPGDVIAIADQAGQSTFGQIRKIGVRAVSLVTREQKEYLIPNENLMINQVENWSYSSRNVRIAVPVGVSYEADMDLAEKLMLEAAKSVPRVLDSPPPVIWMKGFGDNAVSFAIQCWIQDPEEGVGNIQSAVLKKIWALFKEAGIELPYPQRDLHIRGSGEFERLMALLEARAVDAPDVE